MLRSPQLIQQAWQQQQATGPGHADAADAELFRREEQIQDAKRQVRRLLDAYQRGWVHSDELTKLQTFLRTLFAWQRRRGRSWAFATGRPAR